MVDPGGGGGERGPFLTLQSPPKRFCIKIGSVIRVISHFDASLIVRDKVTRRCHAETTAKLLMRKESRSGLEPTSVCLTSQYLPLGAGHCSSLTLQLLIIIKQKGDTALVRMAICTGAGKHLRKLPSRLTLHGPQSFS